MKITWFFLFLTEIFCTKYFWSCRIDLLLAFKGFLTKKGFHWSEWINILKDWMNQSRSQETKSGESIRCSKICQHNDLILCSDYFFRLWTCIIILKTFSIDQSSTYIKSVWKLNGKPLNISFNLLMRTGYGIKIRNICYADISYHTPNMDSSNLNIFSELSSLGGENLPFLTDGLLAEHGWYFLCMTFFFC